MFTLLNYISNKYNLNAPMPKRLIIIEDNKVIADNTAKFLELEGFKVDAAYDGEKWFDMIQYAHNQSSPYDLAILDRMIPGMDGMSIARLIKSKRIPTLCIFLTAKDRQLDILEWLELAEDYLVKPFDLDELVIRLKNIFRRISSWLQKKQDEKIEIDGTTIYPMARKVEQWGNLIELSPKELDIIIHLAEHKNQVISREQMASNLWGDILTESLTDTINVHVAHLRKKLGRDCIRTVKNVGYIVEE